VKDSSKPTATYRRDFGKKPGCSTDPKSVSVMQRVNKFPGEMLTNSAGKLFCSVCGEELSLKLSIINSHVESAKHA